MTHAHDWMHPETKARIDRPPDVVRMRPVIEVEFRRGEGCCDKDLVRSCTAYYSIDGELFAVRDPFNPPPATTENQA